MVRVCHMTSAHGVEDIRIFHKECVSLADAGYEVYLVERGESYDKSGVHIVGVGEIPESRLKRMTKGAKEVYEKALSLDCDIYHFHDPELLPYGVKLKRLGKKVIFDSHEHYRTQIETKDYLPHGLAKLVSKLYGVYEDHVLNVIDGVIFPCPMDGKFPFRCKHTAYVNNVPMLSELYDQYDPFVEKEERTVCLVGSLTYKRGVKHALMAAHRANCRILLGGEVSPAEFKQELIGIPEGKSAVFLGKLNRQQVLETMQKSMIGLSTPLNIGQYDRTDNLSTKACEYMSLGLPVILTRHKINERMIEKYKFGICVDPENTEEYVAAIEFLLDNPEIAKEMGENGRKAIREVFNWELEQKNLLSLYREIVKL